MKDLASNQVNSTVLKQSSLGRRRGREKGVRQRIDIMLDKESRVERGGR
jgi:hypothetical protein